jgi:hypothetical protein
MQGKPCDPYPPGLEVHPSREPDLLARFRDKTNRLRFSMDSEPAVRRKSQKGLEPAFYQVLQVRMAVDGLFHEGTDFIADLKVP